MSWTKIRVNKFTRSIHPDDERPGLPRVTTVPTSEELKTWDDYHFTQRGENWQGRTGRERNWLRDNSNNLMPYPDADDAKAEQPKRKVTRKKKAPKRQE